MDAMSAGKDHVWDGDMDRWATRKFGPKAIDELRGKTYSQLTNVEDKARWIQAYDRVHQDNGFRVLGAGGRFGDFVLRKDGNRWSRMWNNRDDVAKAINILEAQTFEEISDHLGDRQKVRAFYNNIVNPWSDHKLATIDTHMVAASHFAPLSGKDIEVRAAFGNAAGLSKGDSSGIRGTNPVYQEAARIAAEHLNVDPHEIQSVAWHMGKALFDPKFKKGLGNKNVVAGIWRQVGRGELSADQARAKILELVGGVKAMPWLDMKPSGSRSSYK